MLIHDPCTTRPTDRTMPKRKTLIQIANEFAAEHLLRQGPPKRPVTLGFSSATDLQDDYADHSYSLRNFERDYPN
jgi:hypothetical protein